MKQHQFYKKLALDLVDNNSDIVGLHLRFAFDDRPNVSAPTAGVRAHATTTKISKKKQTGEQVSHRVQHVRRACKRHRTTRVCSNVEMSVDLTTSCTTPPKVARASLVTVQTFTVNDTSDS
jgi:hypothetical protein